MQFLVLLWKLAISRYKRYFQTAIECLFSLFIFIIIFTMCNLIKKDAQNEMNKARMTIKGDTYNYSGLQSLKQVVYYPTINWTDKLMISVGEKLGLKKLDKYSKKSGYYGTNNKSFISSYVADLNKYSALILFENENNNELPQQLKYAIRCYEDEHLKFMVHTIQTNPEFLSYPNLGKVYDQFMRLQWAVDTAYIKLKNGKNVFQDLSFKEFDTTQPSIPAMMFYLIIQQFFSITSLVLVFMFHVGRVIEDRVSGVQALLTMSGVSSFMLNFSHFMNGLAFGIYHTSLAMIFYYMKGAGNKSIVEHSNAFLVWLMFLLYFCSILMFGFFVAFALPNQKLVLAAAVGVYFLTIIPTFLIMPDTLASMHDLVRFLLGLLPHQPLYWYFIRLIPLEVSAEGLNFITLFQKSEDTHISAFHAYLMTIFQILLYGSLASYLSLIKPGKNVNAMPWNFFCRKDYWRRKVSPDVEMAEVTPLQKSQYFEQEPPDSQIGIKVIDVSKAYNNNLVLSNLNLNIYKGEITVLLGHNGAGKTTILSIIAGMNKATRGTILINGLDVENNRKKLFKTVGVCPQDNMFFRDLTVIQHIMLFTMIRKNVGLKQARKMSMELLQQLDIANKQNNKVTHISGGMMRRLQLGMALAGDADTLVLDEPTSGLDVETRRDLWDLLLRLRGTRTVLLTTHFMEEADVLGDRVAALHNGQLKCHATPNYLKKAVGQGYLLTLVTLGGPKTEEITNAVLSNVPEATFKEATMNSIIFNLPPETTNKFPQMFQTLEKNRDELGIESIGVGTATLEEVFLTLCSDVDMKSTKETIDAAAQGVEYDKYEGGQLLKSQLGALLWRQLKLIIAKKYSFLCMQVIIPLVSLMLVIMVMSGSRDPSMQDSAAMDLSIYEPLVYKKILLDIEDPELKNLEPKFRSANNNFEFEDVKDFSNVTLQASLRSPSAYKQYLLGLHVDNRTAQVLFSTSVRHAAPVALNLLSNLLAGRPAAITTYNQPVTYHSINPTSHDEKYVRDKIKTMNTSIGIAVLFSFWLASITNSLPKERTTGTRHIFMMYGCSGILYWIFTWIFHAILCMITAILPFILLIYNLEGDTQTLDEKNYLGTMVVILLIGALAVLAHLYFITMHTKDVAFSVISCVLVTLCSWCFPYMLIIYIMNNDKKFFYQILKLLDLLLPVFTLANCIVAAGNTAVQNALAKEKACPPYKHDITSMRNCFSLQSNDYCFICPDETAPGLGILTLFLQAIVYMILLLMSQMGIFNMLWDRFANKNYEVLKATSEDPVALEEINYVKNAMNLPPGRAPDTMLVHELHKRYPALFKSGTEAVKGVSFSVKKGECFGLVGVNGAGKSTMFSMIVGANHITRGTIQCNGLKATVIPGKYIHQLGFCPQYHSLDNFLTGEENLTMLLKLRGYRKNDIKREVDYWINILALEKYRHRRLGKYSGGCKRRLAAAAALLAGGAAALLDEPSSGVDVSARRALWLALRAAQQGGRAVLVSSHSLEEIEALCGRVCILVDGRVRALGPPTDMRRRYAVGHSLQFNIATDESIASNQNVQELKDDVKQTFECTLEDSNKSMLHYRITKTMEYSDIFTAVEGLKARYPLLIQDYTVKEPTLEQVFLSFARQNKTKKPKSSKE